MKIPRNWVKADAVRVRRVNGQNVVEIKRNPAKKKRKPAAKKRKRVVRNVTGFMDSEGEFHPIRHSKGYSPQKAGDFASHYTSKVYKKKAKPTKKKAGARRSTRKRGKR